MWASSGSSSRASRERTESTSWSRSAAASDSSNSSDDTDNGNDSSADLSFANGDASSSSRFGVRRRVRKVLQRAKNRTGIQNASEQLVSSSQQLTTRRRSTNILAESASIGGELGTNDAVFDVDDDDDDDDVLLGRTRTANNVAPTVNNGRQRPRTTTSSSSSATAAAASNNRNGAKQQQQQRLARQQVDAIRSDIPAAMAMASPKEPLPFDLPTLTSAQRQVLYRGERLEEQTKMGRDGSGFVVVDVKAPEYVVWECLLDFESYPETIPTVRDVTMLTSTHLTSGYHSEQPVKSSSTTGRGANSPTTTRAAAERRQSANGRRHYGTPSVTRAAFCLSKFRLNIAAIHKYRPHPDGHYMVFTLDPDCTNLVLKAAKGVWYTETNPEGRGEEYTRVWLLCELKVSRALPSFIVDYAAKRAMPRATTWLKPQVEAAASLWLKNAGPATSPTKTGNSTML